MFNIGDTVSWQVRNMLDTTRGSSSFHRYHGTVIAVSDTEIVATYTWTRNGTDIFEANKSFRKLKNGKWIPSTEKRDDPKGRLYLCLDVKE
jgi:hypothetical protein